MAYQVGVVEMSPHEVRNAPMNKQIAQLDVSAPEEYAAKRIMMHCFISFYC